MLVISVFKIIVCDFSMPSALDIISHYWACVHKDITAPISCLMVGCILHKELEKADS